MPLEAATETHMLDLRPLTPDGMHFSICSPALPAGRPCRFCWTRDVGHAFKSISWAFAGPVCNGLLKPHPGAWGRKSGQAF